MNLCGDCEHWGDDRQRAKEGRYRVCLAIPHGDTHDPAPPPDEPDARAFVVDMERYAAELWCRDDFGCVLFEPNNRDVCSSTASA